MEVKQSNQIEIKEVYTIQEMIYCFSAWDESAKITKQDRLIWDEAQKRFALIRQNQQHIDRDKIAVMNIPPPNKVSNSIEIPKTAPKSIEMPRATPKNIETPHRKTKVLNEKTIRKKEREIANRSKSIVKSDPLSAVVLNFGCDSHDSPPLTYKYSAESMIPTIAIPPNPIVPLNPLVIIQGSSFNNSMLKNITSDSLQSFNHSPPNFNLSLIGQEMHHESLNFGINTSLLNKPPKTLNLTSPHLKIPTHLTYREEHNMSDPPRLPPSKLNFNSSYQPQNFNLSMSHSEMTPKKLNLGVNTPFSLNIQPEKSNLHFNATHYNSPNSDLPCFVSDCNEDSEIFDDLVSLDSDLSRDAINSFNRKDSNQFYDSIPGLPTIPQKANTYERYSDVAVYEKISRLANIFSSEIELIYNSEFTFYQANLDKIENNKITIDLTIPLKEARGIDQIVKEIYVNLDNIGRACAENVLNREQLLKTINVFNDGIKEMRNYCGPASMETITVQSNIRLANLSLYNFAGKIDYQIKKIKEISETSMKKLTNVNNNIK